MLLRCGVQYEFRYVKGKVIPPSAALVRGTCGHRANEMNFRQKIESRADLPADAVLSAFSDEWDKRKYEIAYSEEELGGDSPSKAEGKWKDSGTRLVSIYHAEQAPLIQPVSVEEKFHVDFEGGYPALDGVIDRETEDGAVEDDKFVSKTPPEDDALTDVQLTCYDFARRVTKKAPPKMLRKRFAVDTKTPKTVTREAPPRDEETIARFLRRLEAMMAVREKGMFIPAANGSWWCSARFCGYWNICSYHP